jgi:hypothetical protein
MLEKLSNDADIVYFTDTYGVYKNEWYKKRKTESGGMIYGEFNLRLNATGKEILKSNNISLFAFRRY